MSPYRLSPVRLFAVATFVLSVFVLTLYVWMASGGSVPMAPGKYRVHVLLPQAKGLGQHSDVRVSGVTVGHVVSVDAAPPAGRFRGRADVVIDLDKRYVPLRADATAMLRSKSILGEAYVALSLGSSGAPPVADGGTLDASQALRTVEADEIFRTWDPETRRALQEWLATQSPGLAEHGADLNGAIASLRPWVMNADRLLAVVDAQSDDVAALLADGGDVAAALADRGDAIQTLAVSGDRAFNAVASRSDALADAFRELPAFEREATATINTVTAFASRSTDDVRALRSLVAPLSPAFAELAADAPALRRVVEATPRLSSAALDGLPALDSVLDAAPPVLSSLRPFLLSLNPALRFLASGRSELTGLIANLAAATQTATSTPNSREPVHYLRGMPVLGPQVLGPLSTRPGGSRANAYPDPSSLDLLSGYPSLSVGHCNRGTPYISDEPTPWINDAQREQIRLYAFGDRIEHPPAAPCRLQPPRSGSGTQVPVVPADAP